MPLVPPTANAVRKLQSALGRVGRYTGPLDSTLSTKFVKAVQTHLKHEGVYSGAISGTYNLETAKGLQRYLRALGEYSGTIDGTLTPAHWDTYLASVKKINQAITDPATPLPVFSSTVLPVITGIVKVANVLTVSNGTWGTITPDSYRYQWFKAGAQIVGATANTYTPVVGDIGSVLTATVTAIEEAYANSTATTAPTVAVIA